MLSHKTQKSIIGVLLTFAFILTIASNNAKALEKQRTTPSNFGLPGIIDLPSARQFPDGEIIITHQNHEYLFMTGLSFQALPRLGVSFRYGGQGRGGGFAQRRVNWDRSFDAHIGIINEGKYLPEISIGLRDFIGTGWYSSEYIVGTKSLGNLELTAGIGFGRLAGRNSFSNPFGFLAPRFDSRNYNAVGRGGTFGTINWFHGDSAAFYGARLKVGKNISILSEYTPDLMTTESPYMKIESPWNFGASYEFNDYLNLSAQYLYGSQVSVTAHVAINPGRPPLLGGKELAPVPMRLRTERASPVQTNNIKIIRKVLAADRFDIKYLRFSGNTVYIGVANHKFRSAAQALGRVASTMQRFTSDKTTFAQISLYSQDLRVASYSVDLNNITEKQFQPTATESYKNSIVAIDAENLKFAENKKRFQWGLGPYFEHRQFNPDLPLSMETGIEIETAYQPAAGLKISSTIRKSVLTNLTDNRRLSDSVLPHVHSDWPLYDFAGQNGHIYELTLSYFKNLAPGLYGRAHAGLLEPFFAGLGGEILYKPAQSPIGVGLDIHRVRKRDFDMLFDLRDYETTLGHLSLYYDAGGMFDIELNAGRYLAGDWGVTTTIARKFGSGWEVGGYATLTDVPFSRFGEGSFDKAIYVSLPIDWIISSPDKTKRRLTLRPITRDGGANLASARRLYRQIETSQNANFQREIGRLWK